MNGEAMDAAVHGDAGPAGAASQSRPTAREWRFVVAAALAALLMWACQGLPGVLLFGQVPEIADAAWFSPVWITAAAVFGVAVGAVLWWASRSERRWAGYGLPWFVGVVAYLATLFVGLVLNGLDATEAFRTAFVFGGLVGGAWFGVAIVIVLARWVRPADFVVERRGA